MCVTIPATAVRLVLALLVCCVAVECQDGELTVRAVSVNGRKVQNSTLTGLTNLIVRSDITLVTWNFFPGNDTLHWIQNRVNTMTDARYSLIYSLRRDEYDSIQYAFYYQHALFRNVAFQGYGYGQPFSVWFPFVVIFSVFQPKSKPLTLAALHVRFGNFENTPFDGKRILAEAVGEISANGNPFALIGKFPVDALSYLTQGVFKVKFPPPPTPLCQTARRYTPAGPALLSKGLEFATVSYARPLRCGIGSRYFKHLSINIKMSQLVAEPDVPRPHIHPAYTSPPFPPGYGVVLSRQGGEQTPRTVRGEQHLHTIGLLSVADLASRYRTVRQSHIKYLGESKPPRRPSTYRSLLRRSTPARGQQPPPSGAIQHVYPHRPNQKHHDHHREDHHGGVARRIPEDHHDGVSGRTSEVEMNPAQGDLSGFDLLFQAIEIDQSQAGDRDHRQPHADHSRHINDHQH